ncbi:MAG: redoxin family protein, partial [Lysobacter sp.]|nr:redoxin family protein [Lysobacter sp.]
MHPKLKIGLVITAMAGVLVATVLMAMYSIGEAQRKVEFDAREKNSIGATMPEFSLPVLEQPGKTAPKTVSKRDLLGTVYLLHGWASWCLTCREEHPVLMAFAEKAKVRLIGYNVDDEPELALRWLARYGDPYEFSLVQIDQSTPGVIPLTTTPQLILVDRKGVVRWRRLGGATMPLL